MRDASDYQFPIKTALFVDFDNIYLSLDKLDPLAADYFATDPARWLAWIEQGMPAREENGSTSFQRRSILIRRCYLNPRTFFRFRPYFVQTAFSVIDCPSLTQKGKNSADIHMVMDIIEALEHRTHFDEFIILSGDADFTPVLLKLRAHARQTAILAIGSAPQAYKAASDRVISGDVFIEEALQISEEESSRPGAKTIRFSLSSDLDHTLDSMAERVYEAALSVGELPATSLPEIFKKFPEFVSYGNWLGFYSLRALTEELVRRQAELELIEGDPWRVVISLSGDEWGERYQGIDSRNEMALRERILGLVKQILADSPAPVTMAKVGDEIVRRLGPQIRETQWAGAGSLKQLVQSTDWPDVAIAISADHRNYIYDPRRHHPPATLNAEALPAMTNVEMRERIISLVEQIVAHSLEPVTMARAAFDLIRELGPQVTESEWAGAGSFKQLLQTIDNPGFRIATLPHPGYLYDPLRHRLPDSVPDPEGFQSMPSEIAAFTRRVNQVTGVPRLTPSQYRLIFEMITEYLRLNAFNLSATSKAVRDLCLERGESIPRKSIWFVLQGLIYSGHWFGRDPESDSARSLARMFRENVATLCRDAQLELSEREHRMLEEWITDEVERAEVASIKTALEPDSYRQESGGVINITSGSVRESATASGALNANLDKEIGITAVREEESC